MDDDADVSGRSEARRARTGMRGAGSAPTRRAPLGTAPAIPAGRVTGLRERRVGSARYLLSVDGAARAIVSAEVIARLGLRVGAVLDPAVAEAVGRESAELAVFDKAVELLAARARSGRELQLRLRRAGAPAETIAKAIDRLVALGVLDDQAFARILAQSRVVKGGASRRHIARELQRRGIGRREADEAIDGVLAEVDLDEAAAARAVAERRLRAMRGLDAATTRRRLHGFLARRGYDSDTIARVLRDLLA